MIDSQKELKDVFSSKEKDIPEEVSSKVKRRRNAINSFLNSYFSIFIVVIILALLWVSFSFIIKPKFEKVAVSSVDVIDERREIFIKEYERLESYKMAVESLSDINTDDIEKIRNVIPEKQSREDLFIEMTYFLFKNNFKADSVRVTSPASAPATTAAVISDRRGGTLESESPEYLDQTRSLPADISFWIVEMNIDDIDYIGLKYLLDIVENNLKLKDVFRLEFDPESRQAKIKLVSYYRK
jgi:hypothetical protein